MFRYLRCPNFLRRRLIIHATWWSELSLYLVKYHQLIMMIWIIQYKTRGNWLSNGICVPNTIFSIYFYDYHLLSTISAPWNTAFSDIYRWNRQTISYLKVKQKFADRTYPTMREKNSYKFLGTKFLLEPLGPSVRTYVHPLITSKLTGISQFCFQIRVLWLNSVSYHKFTLRSNSKVKVKLSNF